MVKEGKLLHRYKDGSAEIEGFLEDYAYLIWGLVELYMATFEAKYLRKALELTEHTLKHFWEGGFFRTPDYGEVVLVRRKEIYDGALPSGNSVMAFNLVRLGRLTGREELVKKAEETLTSFGEDLKLLPSAHTFSMIALDLILNGTFELVAVSKSKEEATEELLSLQREFLPEGVFLIKDEETEGMVPFLRDMPPKNGTTFYLCRGGACEEPLTDPKILRGKLRTS